MRDPALNTRLYATLSNSPSGAESLSVVYTRMRMGSVRLFEHLAPTSGASRRFTMPHAAPPVT